MEEDWESVFSDHFGHTPLQTPFGSQDEACAIDLSDEDDSTEPEIDIEARIYRYIEKCENGPGSEHSDDADNIPVNVGVQNPDSDLDTVRTLKNNGCGCKLNCSTKFNEHDMYTHLLNVREMDKVEKEMYMMGALGDCDGETKRGEKRVRNRRQFYFMGQQVCKKVFTLVFSIGEKSLKNLLKHIDQHGAVPRKHGNTGKRKAHGLSFEDIKYVVTFITNYAEVHGLPQPAAPRGRDNYPPIYLHCQLTNKIIHADYSHSLTAESREIKYRTFVKIWNNCVPHILIASPKDDVCATCEKLRKKVFDARDEEEKLESSANMKDHIIAAQNERDLYNECISRALLGNDDGSAYYHMTFDFCQNVSLPHHGRQMGPLYFTTPRKVHIFGVRIDHIPKQLNFLIDENETIGTDGSSAHGPNAVISMIHWALENYTTGPRCAFHADNCPGQNKNQYVLGYFMWRVLSGRNDEITLMMQVPGHARCRVDAGFGLIKQLFRRSDCDSLNQLEDVVNKSAATNEAVRYPSWHWRDWKAFLSMMFRPIKGIRQYQFFKFSSLDPGIVTVRKERGGEETTYTMTRPGFTTVIDDQLPQILVPAGLTIERQRYLFRTVRPFVRSMYQDTTCPAPPDS